MKALVIFVSYVWITTLAGLAIHPYKSVKQMVFDRTKRILLPVVLSPTIGIATLFVAGRVGSSIFELTGVAREVVAFVLGWGLLGLVLWQILMLLLVLRFARALN